MAADIEAIARAWMAHQGYTDDEVLQAEQQTCQSSGCELQGYDYDCSDEEGKSNHPLADALHEACAMANVAVEALKSIGVGAFRVRTRSELDDLPAGATVYDHNNQVWQKLRPGCMSHESLCWFQPGDGHGYHARKVALPARLLDDGL
jgi:hypothetical protein